MEGAEWYAAECTNVNEMSEYVYKYDGFSDEYKHFTQMVLSFRDAVTCSICIEKEMETQAHTEGLRMIALDSNQLHLDEDLQQYIDIHAKWKRRVNSEAIGLYYQFYASKDYNNMPNRWKLLTYPDFFLDCGGWSNDTYIGPPNSLSIRERNFTWFHKILDLSTQGQGYVLVGAAHLVGETGLIQMFKEAGAVVTPVVVQDESE